MGGLTFGVYDSGIGGLTVARSLRVTFPGADIHYLADRGNPLHGFRDLDSMREHLGDVVQFFLKHDANAVVIACNTATVNAILHLRTSYPSVPIFGTAPVLWDAVRKGATSIGVLATPLTVESERFRLIVDAAQAMPSVSITVQACPELAAIIQDGDINAGSTTELLREYLEPLVAANVQTVIFGCTDYVLMRDQVKALMPQAKLFLDGASLIVGEIWDAYSRGEVPVAPHTVSNSGALGLHGTGPYEHLCRVSDTAAQLLDTSPQFVVPARDLMPAQARLQVERLC